MAWQCKETSMLKNTYLLGEIFTYKIYLFSPFKAGIQKAKAASKQEKLNYYT